MEVKGYGLKLFKKSKLFLHPAHNTPKDIRKFFTTPEYKSELREFLQRTPHPTEEKINDFKNHFLRKTTIKDSVMDISLNHGKILNGLEHIQELTLSKDNFNAGFASNVWDKLDFSERFTLLHWLRDSQAKDKPPNIDIVSQFYKQKGFSYYRNRIIMPYNKNCSGLEGAGGIIQNTHLINETNQPTSNGEVKVNNTYVELTDYFKRKNGRKALMNINIDNLNAYDREEVLRLKNLVIPVTSKPVIDINKMVQAKYLVRTFQEFVDYLTHELHYTSPLVVSSLKKRSDELDGIVDKKTFPESDILTLERYRDIAYHASSCKIAPVLQTLSKTEQQDLLDTTLRKRYLFANKKQSTIEYRYLNTLQAEHMKDIYNSVSNKNGELSRV